MSPHLFLFQSGIWLGEGKISFATTNDSVRFYTRWKFVDTTAEGHVWLQEVELHELDQTNRNLFTISHPTNNNFQIRLENESMGCVTGKGIINPDVLAWELRDQPESEGFEIYNRQKNGEYLFRAEYASSAPYRTLIEGRLWLKL